ncbi:MAG: HNH endonuclease [Bdellovibrionota bacterium]
MTNDELETRLAVLVREERRITREVLTLIREADKRRLYRERGFPNIFEWLVKSYGYSQSAAHRRIQAARLVCAIPAVGEKLETGELNLSAVAQVQSAIQREEKRTGRRVGLRDKESLLERVRGKTNEQTQKILAEKFPDSSVPRENLRARSATESTLTIVLEDNCVRALKRARELLAHVLPHPTYAHVIGKVLVDFVNKSDPLNSSAENRKTILLKRAGGRCQFVSPTRNRRCTARTYLEIDHIIPRALGGTDDLENLRVLCREHNQHEAERILGKEFMQSARN